MLYRLVIRKLNRYDSVVVKLFFIVMILKVVIYFVKVYNRDIFIFVSNIVLVFVKICYFLDWLINKLNLFFVYYCNLSF